MVVDAAGRVIYAPDRLAEELGLGSAKRLMANGSPNALQALMPQPFLQIHRGLGVGLPAVSPPAHSCRAGAAVLLDTPSSTSDECGHSPFALTIRKQEVAGGWSSAFSLKARTC